MREVLDKQKLIQWIEDMKEVYGPPYDNESDQLSCKTRISVLVRLKQYIELGEFNQENGEEVKA